MTELLNVKQAAQQLKVQPGFVYQRVESGEIEHIRIGAKAIRITPEALEKFIAHGRHPVNERTQKLLDEGCSPQASPKQPATAKRPSPRESLKRLRSK